MDLSQQVTEFDLPIYFLKASTITPAITHWQRITSGRSKPRLKGFYTFEQSAHCPIFEEPEKAQKILLEDVLNGTNNLADKK